MIKTPILLLMMSALATVSVTSFAGATSEASYSIDKLFSFDDNSYCVQERGYCHAATAHLNNSTKVIYLDRLVDKTGQLNKIRMCLGSIVDIGAQIKSKFRIAVELKDREISKTSMVLQNEIKKVDVLGVIEQDGVEFDKDILEVFVSTVQRSCENLAD